jgi:hypothetical protein
VTARVGSLRKKGTRTGGCRTPHSAYQPGQYFSGALKSRQNNQLCQDTLLRPGKNTEDATYERACIQTWRLAFSQDASRLQKGKVRLNGIRGQVTRANQEIHILHTELFHEEHGKACSCFLHLTTHFTVFQRLPRLYKAVAQVLC